MSALAEEAARLPLRFGGCALCGLAAGHPKQTKIVAENAHAVALLSRYALRRGHLLVVLREHAERFDEISWAAYRGMHELAFRCAQVLERTLEPTRVFVAAFGSPVPLPMTFPHHHLHVVPVHSRDERDRPSSVFTWKWGVFRDTPGRERALVDLLRRSLRDQRGTKRPKVLGS